MPLSSGLMKEGVAGKGVHGPSSGTSGFSSPNEDAVLDLILWEKNSSCDSDAGGR